MTVKEIKDKAKEEIISALNLAEIDDFTIEDMSSAEQKKFYSEYDKMLKKAIEILRKEL